MPPTREEFLQLLREVQEIVLHMEDDSSYCEWYCGMCRAGEYLAEAFEPFKKYLVKESV